MEADRQDFLRPIITPYELTLALKGKAGVWDPAAWTLDLNTVLDEATAVVAAERAAADKATAKAAGKAEAVENGDEAGDDQDGSGSESELEFSLVTGTYRTRKTYGDAGVEDASAGVQDLTLRNNNMSLAKLESAGSMFLQSRSFQGLEPRYGMDEPATLEQGRTGVARGYTEEKK